MTDTVYNAATIKSPLLPPLDIPKPGSLMPVYMGVSLGAVLLGVVVSLGVSIWRPDTDNLPLISAILAFIGAGALQTMNFIKSNQNGQLQVQSSEQVGVLHRSVNSGFEEFTKLIVIKAKEEGRKEESDKQLDLIAVEARIAAAVKLAVAEALLAVATPVVTPAVVPVEAPATATAIADKVVEKMESVDVATIQPKAVTDIVEGVTNATPKTEAP